MYCELLVCCRYRTRFSFPFFFIGARLRIKILLWRLFDTQYVPNTFPWNSVDTTLVIAKSLNYQASPKGFLWVISKEISVKPTSLSSCFLSHCGQIRFCTPFESKGLEHLRQIRFFFIGAA